MAQEPAIVPPLSDSNMTQVAYQIGNVEKFNGDPGSLYTFVSRIDYILALYATGDERQQQIIFGHIERSISGEVMRCIGAYDMYTWQQLRRQLVLNYKPQTPNHVLLEEFRKTPFRGNVRAFLEEAESRRQTLTSKLELEQDLEEKTFYLKLIKSSIESLIEKLPTHIYLRINNHNIPDLRSLINLLQEKGMYEQINHTSTHVQKQNFSDKPQKSFNQNTNQSNNIRKYPTPFLHYNSPIPYQAPQIYQTPPTNNPLYRHPIPYHPNPNNVFQPSQQNNVFQPSQQNNAFQPNQRTNFTSRPIFNTNRNNAFDQNRFGQQPQYQNQQSTQNSSSYVPNRPIKRLRPANSGQTGMSVDETLYQEDAFYQQCVPYDYFYYPTYDHSDYYPENQYQIDENNQNLQRTQQLQQINTDETNNDNQEPNVEQAENFQPQALENPNI
uniref:Retrovirus-related Gag polyprotein from copia-like transposable element 17.6 n=2 Tax=Drosophila melanogaster TaxID=7227 RepID=GAG17_DROME|nr:RecName: Full=Retrovirus-related Gag polyprotein from copia-like transposable element 17.6 [Drosophila melanogaster]CAA25701.1 unnamed protein product [Drosophila melanogaster]